MLELLAKVYNRAWAAKEHLIRDERGEGYVTHAVLGGAALAVGTFVWTIVVPAVKTYMETQIVTPLGKLK